jgi:hypothetical protein
MWPLLAWNLLHRYKAGWPQVQNNQLSASFMLRLQVWVTTPCPQLFSTVCESVMRCVCKPEDNLEELTFSM